MVEGKIMCTIGHLRNKRNLSYIMEVSQINMSHQTNSKGQDLCSIPLRMFFLLAMRLIWEYHMKMGQPHNYKTQDKLPLNMCIQVFELQETCISSSKTQEEQILYLGLRHKQILQRKILEPRNTHNHNIMQIVYQMRVIPLQSTICQLLVWESFQNVNGK